MARAYLRHDQQPRRSGREIVPLRGILVAKTVAQLNDYDVKLVKIQGEFVCHSNEDTDELFLILPGELTIQLRDRDVVLRPGQLFVVPRGAEHCPIAHEGGPCRINVNRAHGHGKHWRRRPIFGLGDWWQMPTPLPVNGVRPRRSSCRRRWVWRPAGRGGRAGFSGSSGLFTLHEPQDDLRYCRVGSVTAPDHVGHQPGPPGLMGCAQARGVIAVEVLEK